MPYQEKYDPIKNHNFRVTIGTTTFGFQRVSGLKGNAEIVNYREGDEDLNTPHKSAGLGRFDSITCVKGLTVSNQEDSLQFYNMLKDTLNKEQNYRFDLTIEVLGKDKSVKRTYYVPNAWVSGYEMGELNAESNEVYVRTLTIEHEGFEESVNASTGAIVSNSNAK